MRWKASRPQPETVAAGGPADTATVVVGIDGLPASWDAFRWACREARRMDGRVVAVLIGPEAQIGLSATADVAVPGFLAVDLVGTEQARQLLAELLREADDLDLTFIDAPGGPVGSLLRVARDVHADLLVVSGARGRVGPRLAARRRDSVIAVVPSSS
jgi:nucleotide-binding universal stress UspA family protein